MGRTFAEVVERVKELSRAEKEELQALLQEYIIGEARRANGAREQRGSTCENSVSEDLMSDRKTPLD